MHLPGTELAEWQLSHFQSHTPASAMALHMTRWGTDGSLGGTLPLTGGHTDPECRPVKVSEVAAIVHGWEGTPRERQHWGPAGLTSRVTKLITSQEHMDFQNCQTSSGHTVSGHVT
jgi:hypothetical protein